MPFFAFSMSFFGCQLAVNYFEFMILHSKVHKEDISDQHIYSYYAINFSILFLGVWLFLYLARCSVFFWDVIKTFDHQNLMSLRQRDARDEIAIVYREIRNRNCLIKLLVSVSIAIFLIFVIKYSILPILFIMSMQNQPNILIANFGHYTTDFTLMVGFNLFFNSLLYTAHTCSENKMLYGHCIKQLEHKQATDQLDAMPYQFHGKKAKLQILD